MSRIIRIMLATAVSVVVLLGCKDEEPLSGDAYVNKWVFDNMKFWYYWNQQIPNGGNQSQDPESFFEGLLSTEDRFSAIYDDYESILKALQGVTKEAGYEFVLYRESETNANVVAQILYIKPQSPASTTSLKRGDLITHINGQQLTTNNYRDLLAQTETGHTITYKPITVTSSSSGSFGTPQTLSLTSIEYEENPNFLSATYDLGGRKAGYLVYNFFASGIGEGSQYNNQLSQTMSDFKNQGVTDLILDLRYNGGGYVDASVHLASLLGKNVDNTKIFTKRQYNASVTDYFKLAENDLVDKFKILSENIGSSLSGNLYILTGPRTASASELIINGLRPYMNVVLIGDVTVGKNVGSIPIYEENDSRNRWLILPIVMKSFNSNNQSNYSNGFIPDVSIDEGIYLYPLGHTDEPVLSAALAHITSSPGRWSVPVTKRVFGKPLGTSLDFKYRGLRNNLIEKQSLQRVALD